MNYEVQTNRVGQERLLEKISHNKIRIMGESLLTRVDEGKNGKLRMFDFENGPCLNVGGTLNFLNTKWIIKKIIEEGSDKENLSSVLLEVDLKY